MAKEYSFIQIKTNMKENGKMALPMEKVFINAKLATVTKETG